MSAKRINSKMVSRQGKRFDAAPCPQPTRGRRLPEQWSTTGGSPWLGIWRVFLKSGRAWRGSWGGRAWGEKTHHNTECLQRSRRWTRPAALLSMRWASRHIQSYSAHTHIRILKLGSSVQDKAWTCGCWCIQDIRKHLQNCNQIKPQHTLNYLNSRPKHRPEDWQHNIRYSPSLIERSLGLIQYLTDLRGLWLIKDLTDRKSLCLVKDLTYRMGLGLVRPLKSVRSLISPRSHWLKGSWTSQRLA